RPGRPGLAIAPPPRAHARRLGVERRLPSHQGPYNRAGGVRPGCHRHARADRILHAPAQSLDLWLYSESPPTTLRLPVQPARRSTLPPPLCLAVPPRPPPRPARQGRVRPVPPRCLGGPVCRGGGCPFGQ